MHILVAGEALIDFVQTKSEAKTAFVPLPGGSPLNVAVGLARLGVPTGFLGKVSHDLFGELLFSYLRDNGVDDRYLLQGPQPSTLAFVSHQAGREPQFAFFGNGAADRQLLPDDVPSQLPGEIRAIHFGSFSMACQPVGSTLTALMKREHRKRIISFDPNVRPSLIPDVEGYKRKLECWIGLGDLVKVSLADLAYLFPNQPHEELAAGWLRLGPKAIVITKGAQGAVGFTGRGATASAGQPIQVVDTVGAGDAFMSGLLAWLYNHDRLAIEKLDGLSVSELRQALDYACRVAALTCTRAGASSPFQSELE
jgi:fructokinase